MTSGFWGLGAPGNQGQRVGKLMHDSMSARAAASHAREMASDAMFFEKRLDKLTLISMAVWSLLAEKMGLTDEDLMERVKKIDLMDGEADGKLQRQIATCPQCNRVMSPRHSSCIYCGSERLQITAFDDVI